MFLHQIKVLVTPYPTVYDSMIFDLRMIKMSTQTFKDQVFEIDQYKVLFKNYENLVYKYIY
jgi:hypothetical protein